jgi:peptide/nickel transport system permease protein
MLRYALRRILVSIPLLLVASFGSFLLVAASGDPLEKLKLRHPAPSPAVLNARKAILHLDDPLPVRYWIWLKGLLHGDLGLDNKGNPVRPQLVRAFGVTLRLVVAVAVVAVVVALAAGYVGALRRSSIADHTITAGAFVCFALPIFWLAVLLKEFAAVRFNHLIGRTWIYTTGQESLGFHGGFWAHAGDLAGHMVLPVITLTTVSVAQYSRYFRSSMLDVLEADHVRTARAKGLRRGAVHVRHGLRNALIPFTTVVTLDFAALLGGAVVTEKVFHWSGMGALFLSALGDVDVNTMQAWFLVSAVVVILMNLVADLLYAALDPRIRLA